MVNVVTLSSMLSVIPKKMNPVMEEQFPPSIFSLFLSKLLENDQEKDTWMCNTSAHLQDIIRENTVLSAIVFIFRKLYIHAPTLLKGSTFITQEKQTPGTEHCGTEPNLSVICEACYFLQAPL